MLDVEALEVPVGTADQVGHMLGGIGRADAAALKRFPGGLKFGPQDRPGDRGRDCKPSS
jgi:hypothetical protein